MEASDANVSGTRLMIGFVFPFYYCFTNYSIPTERISLNFFVIDCVVFEGSKSIKVPSGFPLLSRISTC